MMEDFEQQLKNALARRDAPDWFEAKVLAAIRREPAERPSAWQRLLLASRLRWASVLVVTALLAGGGAWQYQQALHERARGEDAKARLELALKITRVKLHKIEQRLNEMERNY